MWKQVSPFSLSPFSFAPNTDYPPSDKGCDKLPIDVVNNYFSLGKKKYTLI